MLKTNWKSSESLPAVLFLAALSSLFLLAGGSGMLLIALLLAFGASLFIAAILYSFGERHMALRILRWLGVGAIAYLGILILLPLLRSQKVLEIGEPYCPDVLCVAVDDVRKTSAMPESSYTVSLRAWSQADHTPLSLNGYSVYLIDQQGRHFPPVNDPAAYPFHFVLKPRESLTTPLTFRIPPDARELFLTGDTTETGLVSFMIGSGKLVNKPPVLFRVQ